MPNSLVEAVFEITLVQIASCFDIDINKHIHDEFIIIQNILLEPLLEIQQCQFPLVFTDGTECLFKTVKIASQCC